jgi:hypothetical protein
VAIAEGAAALVAWLGACAIVLADGRRGVAVGLALTAAGLGFLAWQTAGPAAALAVAAGGAVAAVARDRSGPPGWNLMPAGSTPRLILCVAAGLVGLWIAASVMTGPGAQVRFSVLSLVGLMGGRVISAREPAVILAAVAALSLAVAEGTSLAPGGGVTPYLVAAVVAAGVMFIRLPAAHAA